MEPILHFSFSQKIRQFNPFLCLFFFMFASHGFAQQLSGTYIIGASGDYTTFNAAVSALTTNGVSGPVIFEVQTGTYSEQVVLGTITGSSATNTITFQSQSGNASDVDIRFGSTSTSIFTVRLEGASHLRFKNLRLTSLNSTNARILAGTGTINDLIVENVVFTAPATTSTLNSRALVYFDLVSSSNLQFLNNSFNGGSTGIIIIGSNDINNPAEGIVVAENTFRSNQFGAMDLSRLLAPRIEGNDVLINSSATNSTSLILSNIRGAVQILNNKFIGSTLRGITLTDVVNTSGTKSLVANNFIAGATLGTNHVVRLDGVSQLNFYHNSLHNYGAGNGIYFVGASGSGVRIINNLIKTGAGLVLDIASASGLASLENLDYNGYFNTGSNIVRLGSGFSAPQYTSLESWQSASGSFEQNSLFGNPFFASNTDLRPASTLFESAGTVLPEVTTDIDSESRSATPSIGAVEYLGIPKVPLAGTYTINSSGSGDRNYTSVGAAVDALNFNGISDAVIFNLASGTYTGQQHQIFPIEGTSSSKTVTFQSQSGDPGTVTISFTPISTANYVISLVGASHLRFKNLSITSTGTSTTLGKTLVASGVIYDFVAENVRFTSANATTTNRNNVDFILGNNSTAITFENCQFTAGYNGLSISRAMTSDIVSDILIKGSTIRTSNLAGISLQGISNLVVDENDILLTTTVANSRPITVGNITGSIQITSNKFIGGAGNSANFQILTATSLNKGLIANNFFSSAGAVSVDLGNFTNINFYHNSIVNSGTGIGLQSAGGIAGIQGLRIINNLIKTGSGAAIRIANTAPVESVDYNGYFTSGSVLGILVNTGIENLSDWQLATGFDANTLNFDPQFISTTDLHASAPAFASTGIALAEVTQDIDGESRDGVNPSRGADEYTAPPLVPMSGEYTINSGISGDRNFQSFDAAINAMISNGINGAVVFKVATGTYTERVTIPGITGISASNSITFESASGNPADVNLLSSATSTETNFVLRLDNAKHVRLRNFTVGTTIAGSNSNARVIDGINNLKDILIENCVLNSNVNTNTSFTRAVFFATATTAENIQFINNKFVGGSHGIYLRLSDLTISIPGLRIEGNEFSNFTVGGIDLNTVSGAKILSNTLTTSSTSSSKVGVNVNVPRDGLELVGNKVFYNRISISNGTLNTAENPGIIANNFIFNNSIGAGLSLNNVSYFQVYHNSISSNGSAFDYIGMSGRLENRVKNNVFRSNSNYSVTVTTATGLTEMDFNDLFSGGANLSRWNGTNATSLAAWRTLSSFDANSINEDPLFVSETDLTPQNPSLSEAGTDLTSVVPSDINGIQRTVPVSIGAIEYSVAGLPMEGDYTIDPSGVGNRNFTGFASASEALQLRGVSGAVRFLIADGTYQEQLNFGAVNGTSEDFTISLESASGNPENVIIQYPIDYVLRLENSEHYSIKNLTFKTTGVDVQVIQVNDRAVNLLFENNIIQNIVEEGSSDTRKGIVVTGNFRENIRIINNQISGGFYGIQVSGSSLSNLAPGVVISGNTITNTSFRSIFLTYNSAPEVSGNRIQTNSTLLEQVAILLENNSNGLLFKENRIESKGGYAIRMNNVTGSASESNLVYNNFLVSEGNLSAVVFSNTTFVDFYHNSVWNRNTGSAFYYFSNGADNKLVNNIFQANTGYSARIESPFAISESNFNNFFNEGMSLGRWGGTDVSNLSNWISTSGKDQNSLSVDSKFVSISDLTPQEGALGINGTDLSSIVENDINGISRTAPFSIGAVQFTAEEAVDIALVQILTPSSNCLLSEQESITVRVSNTGISLAGNISLGYQINDLEPVIEALDPSVVLTPGLTFDYTFLQKAGLSQKGDYSIRVFLAETDEDATNNEVQKSISHFAQPELTLIPEVTICKGQSVVLEAFGVGSFLWNTGSTDRVISVSPLEDTFYTVTLTDQNGCTSEKSVTVIVLETPILEYVGDEGFESSFVSPELGVQNTEFIYRVNYINQNGIFPPTGFPRLTVQSFLETREIIMVEEDPSDTDVTDGKIYRAITTNLSDQVSWSSKIEVQFQAGCPVSTGFFEGPIVSDDFLDVAIFATDILFSNDEPAFNEEFTITAIVRNTSDFVAENFVVSVYDDANLIASTVVDYLEPQSTKEVSWNYSFSISGYHEIKVVLDETEVLDEKNELNNFAIRFYALPEGINVTASLNKTVLLLGESISVSGLATYFGLDLAVTPKVSKAEVTITHSDGRVRNLNTNTNGGFSASFSGPSELGVYTISGQVDDGRFVVPFGPLQFEVVENDDNEPILLPDLESKITLADPVGRAHYLRGESISGVARVTNKGQAPAQNFVFRYSSCEGVIGEVFIPILQPGEFIEYPFVTSVLSRLNSCSRESSENCLFTATADPLRQVVESSRSNNNASIGKQVYAELPDLIPARSSASTFNLEDNYDLTIWARNLGGLETVNPFNINVYVDGVLTDTRTITENVAVCAFVKSYKLSFLFENTEEKEIRIVVDDPYGSGAINEYNETNNEIKFKITYEPKKPDLFTNLGWLSIEPAIPQPGQLFKIKARFGNYGDEDISVPFFNSFIIKENGVETVFENEIAGGAIKNVNKSDSIFTSISTYGNNSLEFRTDSRSEITESDETNNSVFVPLCVELSPIIPTTLSGPIDAWAGGFQVFTEQFLTVVVRNSGLFEGENVSVKFYLNDEEIASTVVPKIVRTSSNTFVRLPYIFTEAGIFNLKVVVDAEGNLNECDEENNTFSKTIEILTPGPDLRVLTQYISPTKINPDLDEEINLFVSYDNIGIVPSGPFKVRLLIDGQQIGEDVQVEGVGAGEDGTVAITEPYSSPIGGIKTIQAIVDILEEQPDPNRSNNSALRTIFVGDAPNLKFTNLVFSNNCPENGDNLTITATIGNEGDVSTEATLKFYYKSGETLEEISEQLISVDAKGSVQVSIPLVLLSNTFSIYAEITDAYPFEYNLLDNSIEKAFCADILNEFELTTSVIGEGIILRNPNQVLYEEGSVVSLSAIPAEGWSFNQWSGDGAGSQNPLSFTFDAAKNVVAEFIENYRIKLNVTNESCFESADGRLEVNIFAGFAPYTIQWFKNGELLAASGNVIDNLSQGLYEVRVTDSNDQLLSSSAEIIVGDFQFPVIVIPAEISFNLDENGEAILTIADLDDESFDNCGIKSKYFNNGLSSLSFDCTQVGKTNLVDFKVEDTKGNVSVKSFQVVITDPVKPVITNVPGNIELNTDAGVCGAVVTWPGPNASDHCGIESLTADYASGVLFPVGETTVTYTATDIHGNEETASFKVIITDLEKPVITNMPTNIEVNTDSGVCGAVVTWAEPNATDNCGIESFTTDFASGDLFQIGETTVTYTATDIHGNAETASFTVTVADLEKPVITNIPANIEASTGEGICGAVVTWTEPSADDNCEIESFTADHTSGDLFPVGETTVTYRATDIHGNVETASFTVTVSDLEKPVITNMPANIEVNTDTGVCGAVVAWTEPNATDNCEIENFTADYASGDLFQIGETTVTYTATDIYGNTETASFTVSVTDVEKPVITNMPTDIEVNTDVGVCGAVVTWTEPNAADNCEIESFTSDYASGDLFQIGETTVTYTATDIYGNTETASFTVSVTDVEKPV
uniref:HYR domain-containing protein n=1 Tax=Algoriphagus sp. TaxID=1872435 RepID=UPI00258A52D8